MSKTYAVLFALAGMLLVPGCNSDDDSVATLVSAPELAVLNIAANGGNGARGGNLNLLSRGNLLIGVNLPPLAPALPSATPTGTSVGNWTGAQTVSTGNARIGGSVKAEAAGGEASLIVTGGDLILSGSLTAATGVDLVLNVSAGTAWIQGSIRAPGGTVRINALRIIFTGSIDTRGGAGADGGDVIFDTAGSQLLVGGSMDLSGGNATGAGASGGDGGRFRTYAPSPGASAGTIHMIGTRVTSHGGSASGTASVRGGDGGSLDLQGNAGVFFNGTFAAVGGNAASSTGGAVAGRGGEFSVNDLAMFDSGPVAVYGSVTTSGGAASGPGTLTGGAAGAVVMRSGSEINLGAGVYSLKGTTGGDATLSAEGDLFFEASLDASGDAAGDVEFSSIGDMTISGSVLADGGGTIEGMTDDSGGSITLRATLRANGSEGSRGGSIRFVCDHPAGSIFVDPEASLQADGGASSTAEGGDGGEIELLTGGGGPANGFSGGNVSLRGSMHARGGAGTAGGTGGLVRVDSDINGDGVGGDITLHSGASVDVSAGSGVPGGDGRNGGSWAVIFDADGADSNDPSVNGRVLNLGSVLARGGSQDGDGGDVLFDGLNAAFSVGPLPGSLDPSGSGAGTPGEFESR